MCAPSLQIRYIILLFLFQCRKARRRSNLRTFSLYESYTSIFVPLRKRKVIRPLVWTVTLSMTASQSFSSNSVKAFSSCTSNMNAPMAFAWASRAVFVARSCSSCVFAFSYFTDLERTKLYVDTDKRMK